MGYFNILLLSILFVLDSFNSYSSSEFLDGINNKSKRIEYIQCFGLMRENKWKNEFRLLIVGSKIRFSDIPPGNFCIGNIVEYLLFASEKITIDKNFTSRGRNVLVALAAPLWKIRGKVEINLNGFDGEEHDEMAADDGDPDGDRNGKNGKEGLPGGPGGFFYGIAGVIINKNNLHVLFNGGRGSAGQDGGSGSEGKSGTKFDENENKIDINGNVVGFTTNYTSKYNFSTSEGGYEKNITEWVLGERAEDGGNGGNGAPGGAGGYRGLYELFNLNNRTCDDRDQLTFIQRQYGITGAFGINGTAGNEGEAGYPGSDVYLELLVTKENKVIIQKSVVKDHLPNLNGKKGTDGNSIKKTFSRIKTTIPESFTNYVQLYKKIMSTYFEKKDNLSTDSAVRRLQNALLHKCVYEYYKDISYSGDTN